MALVAWKRITTEPANAEVLYRAGYASVAYKDRYILILGGRNETTFFLDCWTYDTRTRTIRTFARRIPQVNPRAYHTATLVGEVVWILGGSDDLHMRDENDVWCLDLSNRQWSQPKLQGDLSLLRRTAHGACLHPTRKGCILMFGGYGQLQGSSAPAKYMSDMVIINTLTNTVELVEAAGKIPCPRAYVGMAQVGKYCIVLGGRTAAKGLVSGKDWLEIYDAETETWLTVGKTKVKGTAPCSRSSHRLSGIDKNTALLFGGAPAGGKKHRLSDMYMLKIDDNCSKLEWVKCTGESGGDLWPGGRAAHVQEVVGEKVHIIGGYRSKDGYCNDAWECEFIDQDPKSPSLAVPAARAAASAGPSVDLRPQWKISKRALEPSNGVHGAADGLVGSTKRSRLEYETVPLHGAGAAAGAGGKQVASSVVINCDEKIVVSPASAAVQSMPPRFVAELERKVNEGRDALLAQRDKEAKLLRLSEAKDAEIDRLKKELRTTDDNWKAAAKERDDYKQKCEAEQRRVREERQKAETAEARRAEIEVHWNKGAQQLSQIKISAQQQLQALAAAQEMNAQLNNQLVALRSELQEVSDTAENYRKQKDNLQEQNAVLQNKYSMANSEKTDAEKEIQRLSNDFNGTKAQLNAEIRRLEGEVADAKSGLDEKRRELVAANRRLSELDSEMARMKEEETRLNSRIRKIEAEKEAVERSRGDFEREAREAKNEVQRLAQDNDNQRRQIETELQVIQNAMQRVRNLGNGPSGSRR